MLRCLLSETDAVAFKNMQENFLKILSEDINLKPFAAYFEKYYAKRSGMWAFSYRKWCGINTNMHIERMHRTIKYIYLEGKKGKRLDKTICCLLKFVRDKMFDRLITLEKGKISSKITCIRNRHKKSLEIPLSNIIKNNEEWNVLSQSSNEMYNVKRKNNCCKECPLMCKDCCVCLHEFTCTCIDNSIQWNLCKHIHAICRLENKEKVTSSPSHEYDDDHIGELVIKETNEKREMEKDVHLRNLISNVKSDRLKEETLKLYNDIGKDINMCSSKEDLQELHKLLKAASVSFQAYKERKLNYQQASKSMFNKEASSNEPPNKKIKVQRLFSTKKVKKPSNSRLSLSKPNVEEKNSIAYKLISHK
jgi:hypothetical protein